MTRWTVPLALAAALAAPAAASAQLGLDDLDVRVTPRAGLMTPADWFYQEFLHFGLAPLEWTEASVLRATVVGLSVEVEIPGTGVWIRGEALRTVDGMTSMTHSVLLEASGYEPPRVERTPYRVATAVTTGSLDLAFPMQLRIGPVQPYVTAGVGGKRYSFDTEPFMAFADRVVLPRSGTVPMANVGVGAVVRVLGVDVDVQVRDAMSEYWGRLQHDVMVLGGVAWQLF
ncbi:MAG: hypothetical protein ACOC5I_00580 [Gemmatimonadota bacterium]